MLCVSILFVEVIVSCIWNVSFSYTLYCLRMSSVPYELNVYDKHRCPQLILFSLKWRETEGASRHNNILQFECQ